LEGSSDRELVGGEVVVGFLEVSASNEDLVNSTSRLDGDGEVGRVGESRNGENGISGEFPGRGDCHGVSGSRRGNSRSSNNELREGSSSDSGDGGCHLTSVGVTVSIVVNKHEGISGGWVGVGLASAGDENDGRVHNTESSGECSEVSKEGRFSDDSSGRADEERT